MFRGEGSAASLKSVTPAPELGSIPLWPLSIPLRLSSTKPYFGTLDANRGFVKLSLNGLRTKIFDLADNQPSTRSVTSVTTVTTSPTKKVRYA